MVDENKLYLLLFVPKQHGPSVFFISKVELNIYFYIQITLKLMKLIIRSLVCLFDYLISFHLHPIVKTMILFHCILPLLRVTQFDWRYQQLVLIQVQRWMTITCSMNAVYGKSRFFIKNLEDDLISRRRKIVGAFFSREKEMPCIFKVVDMLETK